MTKYNKIGYNEDSECLEWIKLFKIHLIFESFPININYFKLLQLLKNTLIAQHEDKDWNLLEIDAVDSNY